MAFEIVATGRVAPARRISNDELAKTLDTSDEWIRSHTGMVLRCSGCGWEDWAINYDAEAQGAERTAAAAEKAARAAEDQAEAVQRQAQAQEDLRDLEWYRERENR